MADRAKDWIARYLPLEILATTTALIGGLLAALVTSNAVAIAYVATWAENVGYYGLAFAREMTASRAFADEGSQSPPSPIMGRIWRALTNLVMEFGPAEMLDSFVMRPFCIYMATSLIGNLGIGILFGKLAADVAFYALAVIAYEFRKSRR